MSPAEVVHLVHRFRWGFFVASPLEVPGDGESIPGLPIERVQFWRGMVSSSPHDAREHLLFMADHPALSSPACAQIASLLRPRYPAAVQSFVRNASVGRAEVSADSHASEVAAAVAEVKRAGAWDESDVFHIAVDGRCFEVRIAPGTAPHTVVEAHVTEAVAKRSDVRGS